MLKYPKFRSWAENSPGYALPYDPEWRSVITGRREVEPTDLEFGCGTTSVEKAVNKLLEAFEERDSHILFPLQVGKDEYQLILWPEFPRAVRI